MAEIQYDALFNNITVVHFSIMEWSISFNSNKGIVYALLCEQIVFYLMRLTHVWDTMSGNTLGTTILHNLEYCQAGEKILSVTSSVFHIWLRLSFMFTRGSSAVPSAVGDHLFATGPVPLATYLETRYCGEYSKEAKETRSKGDKSVSQSNKIIWFYVSNTHLMQTLSQNNALCL